PAAGALPGPPCDRTGAARGAVPGGDVSRRLLRAEPQSGLLRSRDRSEGRKVQEAVLRQAQARARWRLTERTAKLPDQGNRNPGRQQNTPARVCSLYPRLAPAPKLTGDDRPASVDR